MSSRPLSADTYAVVKLHTRLDVEAIDLAKGRTEMPAAAARLVQLVPPARVDLVDEVLVGSAVAICRSRWTGRRSTWCTSSPTGSSGCTLERCACGGRTARWWT